jgi:dihydropteroate synthase
VRRFAGFDLDRPLLMGVVNVTPNSFSDGGKYLAADDAIAQGRKLARDGADIIDIGGESTRPGAQAVDPAEEIARVVPVVRALAADGLCVSIDTRNAATMRAALEAGARILNDVTALTHDPDAMAVAAGSDASIILMHIKGEPGTMQAAPHYLDAPREVYDWLSERIAACRRAGIGLDRLCVDPGIGFGKSVEHNCQILAQLERYQSLGVPVLLGVSRKSFIGALSKGESADNRLPGSLAAALFGLAKGVQILRAHDIAETAQAVAVWRAIQD